MLRFVFINGPPSAGKDTQADLLKQQFPHSSRISTGDIYRGARDKKGRYRYYWDSVQEDIKRAEEGGLIQDETILGLVDTVVRKAYALGTNTFVFTGFPRTIAQLRHVDRWLKELKEQLRTDLKHAFVELVLDDHIAEQRRQIRYKQALDAGKTPRSDDVPEKFRKRFHEFYKNTEPMLTELRESGRSITVGAAKSIPEVFHDLATSLEGASFQEIERSFRPTERR